MNQENRKSEVNLETRKSIRYRPSGSDLLLFCSPSSILFPGFLIKLFNLAGDEFLQLHHVGGEFANPLAGFFVGHRVVVQ